MKDVLFSCAMSTAGASGAVLFLFHADAKPTLGLSLWYALATIALLVVVGAMERREPRK